MSGLLELIGSNTRILTVTDKVTSECLALEVDSFSHSKGDYDSQWVRVYR
jgi:hypothetical protein